MPSTFDKLNLTTQELIVVLNAPLNFAPELASLRGVEVLRSLDRSEEAPFWLAFVTAQEGLDQVSRAIASKTEAGGRGDPIVWFAFNLLGSGSL